MLDVVTFKWNGNRRYTADHVNALARMVRRHYQFPYRFTAITDDARGVGRGVRCLQLWDDHASVAAPYAAARKPSCYRRLKLFAPEARELIGERIVCLDLDVVLTGDMGPLWNRPEDVVFYKGQWGRAGVQQSCNPYNGSMFLLTAGARPRVWTDFDPQRTPHRTRAAGYGGSDQAWYALALGPHEAVWTRADGVYSYRNDIMPRDGVLPADARAVMFHGKHNPWDNDSQRLAWVRLHCGGR